MLQYNPCTRSLESVQWCNGHQLPVVRSFIARNTASIRSWLR
jgi:hypothetical protein